MIPVNSARTAGNVIGCYLIKGTDFNGTIQPTLPSIAANSSGSIVVTLRRQFKLDQDAFGNAKSFLTAVFPDGTPETAGIDLVSIVLHGPASGSYAAGNRPTATITWQNTTSGALTPAARDYQIMQVEVAALHA